VSFYASALPLVLAQSDSGDLLVAQNVAFGIIAAMMLFSAWRVVSTTNVVHAALYLVIVLAGVAANFILLGAEFVGVTQVLVYIGAVVVLFLFGIMLTRARLGEDETVDDENRLMAALTGVLLAVVMGYALIDSFDDARIVRDAPSTTQEVSDSIFSDYIIPFEAVSVLLLAALIGAIVVARREDGS
jgi:NADH-quinone oxidoreductase subunit J